MSEERRASCGCSFDGEWALIAQCKASLAWGDTRTHIARAAAEIARQQSVPHSQPAPIPRSDQPDITELVIERLKARREQGIATYGTTLQPFNGRRALLDLLEELLDGAQYAEQAMWEQDHPEQPAPNVGALEAVSEEEATAALDAHLHNPGERHSISGDWLAAVRWREQRGGADWRGLLERYYATIRHWTVVRNDGGVEPVASIDAEVATALAQRPAASAEGEQTP